jgi:hypothetical protein
MIDERANDVLSLCGVSSAQLAAAFSDALVIRKAHRRHGARRALLRESNYTRVRSEIKCSELNDALRYETEERDRILVRRMHDIVI